MAKNIKDVGFHNGLIRSDPDYFFKATTIAGASGPTDKVEKLLGDIQGSVEIVVVAAETVTNGAVTPLTVVINRAAALEGAVTAAKTVVVPVSTSVDKGAVIARFIPGPNDNGFYSVAFTSAATNTGFIEAFQHPVSR